YLFFQVSRYLAAQRFRQSDGLPPVLTDARNVPKNIPMLFPPASGPRFLQAMLPAIQFPGRPKHRYVKSGPYPKGFAPAPIYNVHSNLSESTRHIPSGARTKRLLQDRKSVV